MTLRLAEYAAAKKLDPGLLRSYGLRDGPSGLEMPYYNRAGDLKAVRIRLSLNGNRRFLWRKGDKPMLYGLWMPPKDGAVVIVEGESDAHTLWEYGIHALGVPGASCWRKGWGKYLPDCRVFVADEKDDAGARLVRRVADDLGRPIRRLKLPTKDASDLHLRGGLVDALHEAMDKAEGVFPETRREPVERGEAPSDFFRLVERLNAKKVGREWTALCPFHPDRRPSLSLSQEKGVYFCFGCGAKGTLRWLERELGLERRA